MRKDDGRWRRLVENAPDVIFAFRLGPEEGFEMVSGAVADVVGYTPEEVYARADSGRGLVHPEDLTRLMELVTLPARRGGTYRFRLVHRDGSTVWVEARVVMIEEGEATIIEGVVRDISALQATEAQLRHYALHDAATGLPNRRLLGDYLERAVRAAGRSGRLLAVLFLDLDRFKDVNDSLGHDAGDRLLTAVAERLAAVLRPRDVIARFGGDEFAVVMDDLTDVTDATRAALRLQAQLKEPFSMEGHLIFASASIGIAVAREAKRSPEELLRDADLAMYRAKAHGRDRIEIFDESLHVSALERLATSQDLHAALNRDQLRLLYRPTVALDTDTVVGVEAVLEWDRPGHSTVPPAEFRDIAERTGLIIPIGRWTLERACRQLAAWQQSQPAPDIRLAVEVSAAELTVPGYADHVAAALAVADVPADGLVVAVAAPTNAESAADFAATLGRLAALGVNVAIDLATGLAWLTPPQRLPVHAVRIDPAITASVHDNAEHAAAIGALIEMAHTLELTTVARGVNHPAQLDTLRRLGCDLAQGDLLGTPQPPDTIARQL